MHKANKPNGQFKLWGFIFGLAISFGPKQPDLNLPFYSWPNVVDETLDLSELEENKSISELHIKPKDWEAAPPLYVAKVCWKESQAFPTWRTMEWRPTDLANALLKTFPKKAAIRGKKPLNLALPYAEKYCLDPLWMTSLMFVESSFILDAVSKKKARGPLQMLKETAFVVGKQWKGIKDTAHIIQLLKTPETNIEMGHFYFRKLLTMFRGNYAHATVAYNMGPQWVKNQLAKGHYSGFEHNYFKKVEAQHQRLLALMVDWAKKQPPMYMQSLVVNKQPNFDIKKQRMNIAKGHAMGLASFMINYWRWTSFDGNYFPAHPFIGPVVAHAGAILPFSKDL